MGLRRPNALAELTQQPRLRWPKRGIRGTAARQQEEQGQSRSLEASHPYPLTRFGAGVNVPRRVELLKCVA